MYIHTFPTVAEAALFPINDFSGEVPHCQEVRASEINRVTLGQALFVKRLENLTELS